MKSTCKNSVCRSTRFEAYSSATRWERAKARVNTAVVVAEVAVPTGVAAAAAAAVDTTAVVVAARMAAAVYTSRLVAAARITAARNTAARITAARNTAAHITAACKSVARLPRFATRVAAPSRDRTERHNLQCHHSGFREMWRSSAD